MIFREEVSPTGVELPSKKQAKDPKPIREQRTRERIFHPICNVSLMPGYSFPPK